MQEDLMITSLSNVSTFEIMWVGSNEISLFLFNSLESLL